MKYSWLTVSLTAMALSGCGSMVYGPTPAPVVNQSSYGQQVHLNPNMQQTGNAFAPAVRQQPPSVAQAPRPVPVQQQQMQQPSPYQVPPQGNPAQRAAQQAQQQQGWNTPAQPTVNAPPRVYDEPKLPSGVNTQTTGVANNAPPAVEVNNRPMPVRPPERTAGNTVANGDIQTAQSSGNTPPPVQTTRQVKTQPQEPQQVASNRGASSPSSGGGNNTAVSSLLKQASASLGKGDLDGAAAYLENAQRIEPQNSKILYDIANIRYHQGRHREAESMASRAVQVGGDSGIKKKAWTLISKSRSELGDHQGAINAANKANDL